MTTRRGSGATALVVALQLRSNARWLLAALGATTVIFLLISFGVALGNDTAGSVWDSAGYVLPWLFFSAGIAFGMWFPLAVAHGITRRSAWSGSALAMLIVAVAGAVLMLGGHLVELAAFRLAGRPYEFSHPHLFTELWQVHLVLLEYTLNYAAMLVSGGLIYLTYYRTNALIGTLLIPVGMLPAVATFIALAAGWSGDLDAAEGAWIGTLGMPLAALLATVAVAVGFGVVRLVTRTMPISGKAV